MQKPLPPPVAILALLLAVGCDVGKRDTPLPGTVGRPNVQEVLVSHLPTPSVEDGAAPVTDERFDLLIREYRAYLAMHPEDLDGNLEFGTLLNDVARQPAEALFHLQYFVEMDPHSPKADIARAALEKAKGALAARARKFQPGKGMDEEARAAHARALSAAIAERDATISALQDENARLKQERQNQNDKIKSLEKRIELMSNGTTDTAPRNPRRSPALAYKGFVDPPAVTRPVAAQSDVAGAVAATNPPGTWTVRPGDTLESISTTTYGTASRPQILRRANPGKIGPNGALSPGTTLVCP